MKKIILAFTLIFALLTLTGCNALNGVKLVDQDTMAQRFEAAGMPLTDEEHILTYAGCISWRDGTTAYSYNLYDKNTTALITYNDLTNNLANCAWQQTVTKGNNKCWKADNGEMAYAIYRVENMVVYGQAPIAQKETMFKTVDKLVKG